MDKMKDVFCSLSEVDNSVIVDMDAAVEVLIDSMGDIPDQVEVDVKKWWRENIEDEDSE